MKIDTLQKFVDQQLENWATANRDEYQAIVSHNDNLAGKKNVIVFDLDDANEMEVHMLGLKICYVHSYWALFYRHMRGCTNEMLRDRVKINEQRSSINTIIKLLGCGEHYLGALLKEKYQKKH